MAQNLSVFLVACSSHCVEPDGDLVLDALVNSHQVDDPIVATEGQTFGPDSSFQHVVVGTRHFTHGPISYRKTIKLSFAGDVPGRVQSGTRHGNEFPVEFVISLHRSQHLVEFCAVYRPGTAQDRAIADGAPWHQGAAIGVWPKRP